MSPSSDEAKRLEALFAQEKPSFWSEEGNVLEFSQDEVSLSQQRQSIREIRSDMNVKVSLCWRPVKIEGYEMEYKRFYIIVSQTGAVPMIACWHLGSEEAQPKVVFRPVTPDDSQFAKSENIADYMVGMTNAMRERLEEVVGLTSFSVVAQNDEHVFRYVWSGRWYSDQAKTLGVGPKDFSGVPRGLSTDCKETIEINCVFYGKVSSGKSQLVRALLSEATGATQPADLFKISAVGGSTVSIRSYFYEDMVLGRHDTSLENVASSPRSAKEDARKDRETNSAVSGGEAESRKVRLDSPPAKAEKGEQDSEREREQVKASTALAKVAGNAPEEEEGMESEQRRTAESVHEGKIEEASRERARVVFWDTPGIGLKRDSGLLPFSEIKKAIDEGVSKVDLCVFVFNGDGDQELYQPYLDMVNQIATKNGYAVGSPEFKRAVRRVILVRTHGDAFEWDNTPSFQEQFDQGPKAWPADLNDLLESIAKKLTQRLSEAGLDTVIRSKDISHVSTRAYMPDYSDPKDFETVLNTRTYGIRCLLDRIFATATTEINIFRLEHQKRKLAAVVSGITQELAFGSTGGSVVGLGLGGLAFGAYTVAESLLGMYGASMALGAVGTTAVVGVPVVACSMLGGLAAAIYKRAEIKHFFHLNQAGKELESSLREAGHEGQLQAASAVQSDSDDTLREIAASEPSTVSSNKKDDGLQDRD